MVILITGKKGAGKSYYAQKLVEEMRTEDYKVYQRPSERELQTKYNNKIEYQTLELVEL